MHLTVDESALDTLVSQGYDPRYGARPLRRAIQTAIEDPAAELMLSGALREGGAAYAAVRDGKIVLTPAPECGSISSNEPHSGREAP